MKAKSFSDSHAELVLKHCPGDSFMYKCAGQGIAFLTGKAMDDAVMAFLLECGTPFDVVETKIIKQIIKPSKGKVNRIIKHRLDRQPTPKPAVSDEQLDACKCCHTGWWLREEDTVDVFRRWCASINGVQ